MLESGLNLCINSRGILLMKGLCGDENDDDNEDEDEHSRSFLLMTEFCCFTY